MTPKQRVLEAWKCFFKKPHLARIVKNEFWIMNPYIPYPLMGSGKTPRQAWGDAASKIVPPPNHAINKELP